MSFNQTTFLGASISSYNCSIGWGDSPSTLSVFVIEDPDNGDLFLDPPAGTPVSFQFDEFRFDGIIRSSFRRNNDSANPNWEIILEDPREILTGVQLILNNYYSSVYNVPNLLNVYGYWEAGIGFGTSLINDVGIPWYKVRDGVINLTRNFIPAYGGPIMLGPYSYEIDLTLLPILPNEYRISATSMSLMDFIAEICEAANHDFFFTLVITGLNNVITLTTVNRNTQIVSGAISRFIAETEGAIAKDSGIELKSEVTGKFLTGGNASQIYIQSPSGGDDNDLETDPIDNNIWPFWGFDPNGNAILGEGVGNDHTFYIDTRGVYIDNLPDQYWTDIGEMRAAGESQASWETYLFFNNGNKYKFDADGRRLDILVDPDILLDEPTTYPITFGGVTQSVTVFNEPITRQFVGLLNLSDGEFNAKIFVPYFHRGVTNIHFGKCGRYSIPGYIGVGEVARIMSSSLTDEDLKKFSTSSFFALRQQAIEDQWRLEKWEPASQRMYQFLKAYSDEYYGKKFMVRIPFVYVDINNEGQTRLSVEPDSSGFLDESEWEDAISNNLLPYEIDKLLDSDNKIYCYARYDVALEKDIPYVEKFDKYLYWLDIGDTPQEAMAFNNLVKDNRQYGYSVFIKCELEPYIVYTDVETKLDPRVIINIPDVVSTNAIPMQYRLFGLIKFFYDLFTSNKNKSTEQLENLMSRFGSDIVQLPVKDLVVFPNIVGLPLRSNIQTYGPWYATGANGKLEYEQDESLVPWNFGSFTAMNAMAEAKVGQSFSQYLASEAGSIEVPGTPTLNLGSQLIAGGPYVTDINVTIAGQGVTTNYNMRTWTPHPYAMRKLYAENLQRRNLLEQRVRRDLRRRNFLLRENFFFRAGYNTYQPHYKPQNKNTTSHPFIVGETIKTTGIRESYRSEVLIQPPYNTVSQLKGDYNKKVVTSLDAIFRPFSTDFAGSGIAHFEQPTSSGNNVINLQSLNPFTSGTDIMTSTFRSSVPKTLSLNEDHISTDFRSPISRGGVSEQEFSDLRGMALRGPVIIAGWGYDTAGKPVPNSGENTDNFHQDYKNRSDLWKTGPFDTRWDDERKVWVAGSNQNLVQILDRIPSNIHISGDYTKQSGIGFFDNDHYYPISTNFLSYTSTTYSDNGTPRRAYDAGAVYLVRYIDVFHSGVVGSRAQLRPSTRVSTAAHFRATIVEPSSIWIAQNVNNYLILDNQTQLIDFNSSTSVV